MIAGALADRFGYKPALAVAFAPVMLPLAVVLALVVALGTLLARGSLVTAGWSLAAGLGAVAGAAVLNLPWITSWTWEGVVGAPPVGEAGLGLVSLASFEIGTTDFAALALALYLPVLAGVMLGRGPATIPRREAATPPRVATCEPVSELTEPARQRTRDVVDPFDPATPRVEDHVERPVAPGIVFAWH